MIVNLQKSHGTGWGVGLVVGMGMCSCRIFGYGWVGDLYTDAVPWVLLLYCILLFRA